MAFTLAGWVETTLLSRPITSTAERLQVSGPFSSQQEALRANAHPHGALPATPAGFQYALLTDPELSALHFALSNTLMGGVPRNLATNRFRG